MQSLHRNRPDAGDLTANMNFEKITRATFVNMLTSQSRYYQEQELRDDGQ